MTKHSEIMVEIRGIHLCCQGCVDAVDTALMSTEGINSRCNMENGTVTFTVSDNATAQKALDALAVALPLVQPAR